MQTGIVKNVKLKIKQFYSGGNSAW